MESDLSLGQEADLQRYRRVDWLKPICVEGHCSNSIMSYNVQTRAVELDAISPIESQRMNASFDVRVPCKTHASGRTGGLASVLPNLPTKLSILLKVVVPKFLLS